MNKESVNGARSLYYGFLSKMFVFTEEGSRFDGIKEVLDVMIANPMDENSREALIEIRDYMNEGGYKVLSEEYDEIFHNPQTATVRNTASYYDEGVESGRKRLEVKNFLAKTKIRRDETKYREAEDSVGFLVIFMHELIELIISGEESYDTLQHCLFEEILNEFMDEFIINLYEHSKANIYKSLAVAMSTFMEFERLYFNVNKPKPTVKAENKSEPCEFISDVEARRRAENRIKKSADSLVKSCALEDSAFEDEAGMSDT